MQTLSRSFLGSTYVDLHVHSDASDGSLPVSQLIDMAIEIGIGAISIADHDTVDGTCEALERPQSPFLEILPGIEVSADHPSEGMHILGYLFRPDALSLKKVLKGLQDARVERNLKIIRKLQRLGLDIVYSDVEAIAVRGQVGRPHFALALVKKGAVRTVAEAFNRFLKKGRPGHAPKFRLPCIEAIKAILEAGGVPILAHPGSLRIRKETEMETVLLELKAMGLKGLEVYYTEHSAKQQGMYERLAVRHELVMTGGTDFHGATKPDIHLGVGKGHLRVPYRVVEALKRAKEAS